MAQPYDTAESAGRIRYCTNCGHDVPADGHYCTECGSTLPDVPGADERRGTPRPAHRGGDSRDAFFDPRSPEPPPVRESRHRPPTARLVWDPTDTAGDGVVDGGTVVIESGVLDASNALDEEPIKIPLLDAYLEAPGVKPIHVVLRSERDRFIIGRDADHCHLVLDDPMVSRVHAAIGVENGIPLVEDLDSTNGVFVSGIRVRQRVSVRQGGRIRIGRTDLTLALEGCSG